MEINGCDFLDRLGADISACIFTHLDDPADLIRANAVSQSWNKFVISKSLVKNLCIRLHPEVSYLVPENENDHNVYQILIRNFASNKDRKSCINTSIAASSTNQSHESIENSVGAPPSYWSSKGEDDNESGKSETLTYFLSSELCIVDEIKIRPWLAKGDHENDEVFSAKFVRFKIGCSGFTTGQEENINYDDDNINYEYTYISPKFPMRKENDLQSFKLPHPVLCMGGIVQIELIGRTQRCYVDNRFYIRVTHVQVIGRPTSGLALRMDVSKCGIGDILIQYFVSEGTPGISLFSQF